MQGEASHSSEELQYLLDQGKETGALDSTEHELIQNVFDFNERVVKNIMVPRTKISGVDISTNKEELLEVIISEGYSRIPVYDNVIDKIVGYSTRQRYFAFAGAKPGYHFERYYPQTVFHP